MMAALYEGQVVEVGDCAKERFDSLMRDAERIMGLRLCKRGSYLVPPDKGSNTWQWATHFLALRWPAVVTVWAGGLYRIVGLSELGVIGEVSQDDSST